MYRYINTCFCVQMHINLSIFHFLCCFTTDCFYFLRIMKITASNLRMKTPWESVFNYFPQTTAWKSTPCWWKSDSTICSKDASSNVSRELHASFSLRMTSMSNDWILVSDTATELGGNVSPILSISRKGWFHVFPPRISLMPCSK